MKLGASSDQCLSADRSLQSEGTRNRKEYRHGGNIKDRKRGQLREI
jgi:hypothetical protein